MRNPCSNSVHNLISGVIASVTLALLVGCGNPAESAVKKLFRPSPDRDVTTLPQYNFSAFTNTVWKTKVKVAIADMKRYTGAPEIKLLAPQRFDPADPRYTPTADTRIVAVLPPGARLRIARLLQDQGAWGGVQVEAVLQDGTNAQKVVYLDGFLLTGNAWSRGPASNKSWSVDPEMLEAP